MHTLTAYLRPLLRFLTGRPRNAQPFEELFNRFREVLDKNNRSLESITEMGEILGGDYLFDIQYVNHSYERIAANVQDSLAGFDRLTECRYPHLHAVFSRIDGQIRHVINDTAPPTSHALVIPYEGIAADMVNLVGGKNCNLAEIKNRLNVNVPDAFAVTTRAFDAFLQHNRVFEKSSFPLDGSAVSGAELHDVREQILHGAMPPDLGGAIDKAVRKIRSRSGAHCSLAVRSSAGEEDGEFSFAGQFETILNVPLETTAVEKAYRKVIASLFSEKAALYQTRLGYRPRDMKMAVACVAMVDAASSGVLYSADPQGDRGSMIINAAWGLGSSIVEGQTDADRFRIKKDGGIVETSIGAKDTAVVMRTEGGVGTIATPFEKKGRPSLSPEQVNELARLALALEQHFKRPQDIEWAIDQQGKIFILQSRALRLPDDAVRTSVPAATGAPVLLKHQGYVVQKGVAAGPVFIIKNEKDLEVVPRGAILVARRDSSNFVRVMTDVAAIITDIGTPTSHMAALCREFKIPTVVNAGNATQMLAHGQEITVQVDGEGATLYQGTVRELLEQGTIASAKMEALYEFRKKRYLLRYLTPLNLIDPLRDEFTPDACRTMHDILRFIHEKAVAELIENAERTKHGAIKLELPIPAGLMLIDIGGGLKKPEGRNEVTAHDVVSIPLQAVIKGMTMPGLWRSDVVPLRVNDFMTSMLRVPDLTTDAGRVEQNMAVISRDYANISLKFGYHYIVMDCFCSETAKNNHIYFRFAGGATDMSKRSRRLSLIAAILGEYGFTIKTKGDLIIARLANIERPEAIKLLDQLGRLFSYTRQLDALLNDDQAVERYTRAFIDEDYQLEGREH